MDFTMRAVCLRVKEFMTVKFSSWRNTRRGYFIQQREWNNVPYSQKEINDACKNIVNIQKVQNGYVRPLIWRGSEMMAISAQKIRYMLQ